MTSGFAVEEGKTIGNRNAIKACICWLERWLRIHPRALDPAESFVAKAARIASVPSVPEVPWLGPTCP